MPTPPAQADFRSSVLGFNLVKNGNFESWSSGTTSAPDGWATAGGGAPAVARNGATIQFGTYSARVTGTGAADTLQYDIGGALLTYFKGNRKISIGCWVNASTGGTSNIAIDDGVNLIESRYHSGSGSWEFLVVTATISSTATLLRIRCNPNRLGSGSVSTFYDGMIAVEGDIFSAFFPNPNDEHLRISNFQSATPANNTDQGVWRSEIGAVTTSAGGGVTVSFQASFTTLRTVYLVSGSGTATEVSVSSLSTTSFIAHAFDTAGTRVAITAYWMAVGNV